MKPGRLLCPVLLGIAWGIAVPSVAAFGVPTVTWASNSGRRSLDGNNRWVSSQTAAAAAAGHSSSASPSSLSCRVTTRAGSSAKFPSSRPPRSVLRDTDSTVGVGNDPVVEDMGKVISADADVELQEGEELLGTVDVSPEEIADFFAQPS